MTSAKSTIHLEIGAESRTIAMLDVLAIAGLMLVGASIRMPLPFSPVPVSLQTFTALIAAFLVGPRRAGAGIGLYVALGLAGAPLFTVTSGATLGYLLAFIATPAVVSAFRHPLPGMLLASAMIYLFGAGWLAVGLGMSVPQAVLLGVVPFVPGDVVKLALAWAVARRLSRE
jgi:biotin transport system substrate-specific component